MTEGGNPCYNTVMVILKKALYIAPIFILILGAFFLFQTDKKAAATDYCVTQACLEAEKALNEANQAAAAARNAARTLQGEVAYLNAQIVALEAKIRANKALAADLTKQIKENKEKLEKQENSLASLLIDRHFETEPDAIIILAGSNSISDYAERQARDETVKTQIALSAQAIKTLKEQLEAQKNEVDSLIAEQQVREQEIANVRAQKNALIAQYQHNAAAYSAQAKEAEENMNAEIVKEIQRLIEAGVSVAGTDTYIYRDVCNPGLGARFATPPYTYNYANRGIYGGVICQCTGYVGWKAWQYTGHRLRIVGWGDAKDWISSARRRGYTVSSIPRANSIAVLTSGTYGHVMWVEQVISGSSIIISDYNYYPYSYRSTRIRTYSGQYQYIYL